MMRTQGVRHTGSAVLDLCYVACGRVDGLWEFGLRPWDIAAGALIVTEAGGPVTNLDSSIWISGCAIYWRAIASLSHSAPSLRSADKKQETRGEPSSAASSRRVSYSSRV